MKKYKRLLAVFAAAALLPLSAAESRRQVYAAEPPALAKTYNADVNHLLYVTDVENQAQNNYCWAYMADAVLESYLMRNEGASRINFNESDMFARLNGGTYGFTDLSKGGSYHQAIAYWTRGSAYGPYLEGGGLTDYYVSETAELGRYSIEDERGKQTYIQQIKNLVVRNGAVGVSLYFQDADRALTTNNGAYYYPQDASPGVNHGVTVVGWNDNFSKDLFYNSLTVPHQPQENGAFLVKNSWGRNDGLSIGGNTGYYWISYENYFQDAFAVTQVARRSQLYDYIYETDYRGLYGFTTGGDYSNLYRLNGDRQQLTGFATYVREGGFYRFYVNGMELTQFRGRMAQSGYHVFRLAEPLTLTGQTLEIYVETEGLENAVPTACSAESYLEDTDNVCLKAFTKSVFSSTIPASSYNPPVPSPVSGVTGVMLTPQTCTVRKGAVRVFSAQVTGIGTFRQDIVWRLSGNSSLQTKLLNGILYVGADETSGELSVYAISGQDTAKSALAKVTIEENAAFSQNPGVNSETNIPVINTNQDTDSGEAVFERKGTLDKSDYNCWQNGTASYVKYNGKTHIRILIPANVRFGGRTYAVTALEDECAMENKKISNIVIGKNVTRIGAQAFYGCSRVTKIKITSQKLTQIGTDAFDGISSKAVIYVPRSRLGLYRILIRESGNWKAQIKAYD